MANARGPGPDARRFFRGHRRRAALRRLLTQRNAAIGVLLLIAAGVALNIPTLKAYWPKPAPVGTAEGAQVRVIDGDTLQLPDGERVRLLNIDTAEMPPRSACELERVLALRAKARMQQLVLSGRLVLYAGARDQDVYGRSLRRVEIDGRDLGEQLIAEGLAQRWTGENAQWC